MTMPNPWSFALQRARLIGTHFFYRFGIHCATHQIRLILVSSVVITSLLFPAIASYYSSQSQYFAGFTLRVLDSFLTPDDISSYFAQHDLRHLWEGDSALRTRADSVARARCGMEGILREERVLVGSVSPDEGLGALDKNTLLATLRLERRISSALSSRSISCLRTRDGSCFTLSPSAFWNYDEQALVADNDVVETLNILQNVTISGVPITPDMVMAGREFHDPSSNHVDAAMFLVLTYFFPEKECFGNDGHFRWLHALEDAGGGAGELVVLAQEPHLVALEYRKNATIRTGFTILSAFTYATYTAFGVYCFWLFRRMNMVHSRIGLAFTGMVEIVVSTITSVSVCALVGFRVTMVPWELFPIIVVFIGVENMYSIVDAVVKTSITLPVKERIAQGLSRAGTSNTLKVVSYNALLGVLAVFSSGAIRQFCSLSIVVLVAHWFLVHTFFVTVVSIDIQRLELDELLRQGANLTPNVIQDPRKISVHSSKTTLRSTWSIVRELVRGRPAKNISLVMLLAITAALWYSTTPQAVGHQPHSKYTAPRNPLAQLSKTQNQMLDNISPGQSVWQILNPVGDPLIHIRIESPAILVLGQREDMMLDDLTTESDKHSVRPRVSRYWSRTIRPVVWLLKIFIMPITGTTVLLYGLLLYLLKDAELLEAQRHTAEPTHPAVDEPNVEGGISFTTLPRAFTTDIELIATSKDGKTIATVGLENEFVIWRTERQSHVAIDTSTFILGGCASTLSASSTLTAVAMNSLGNICAAGTGAGTIAVFLLGKDQIKPLPHFHLEHLTSGVTALHFTGSLMHSSASPSGIPSEELSSELTCYLYASYENGAVIEWDILSPLNPRYITPSRAASVCKSILLPIQADGRLLVGFSLDDGMLELCNVERDKPVFKEECAISAGNPSDLVAKVHVCLVELDGAKRIIVGTATQAGVISLWDAMSKECLIILDEPFGDINALRLTPVHTATCITCGELPIENFSITFSVGHVVQFYRAYLTLPTRRCSCPRNLPQQAPRSSLLVHRARSGSNASVASTGANTPVRPRSRRSSLSSPSSSFPVSGHGIHSRRVSEKDNLRRASETFLLSNPDYFEHELPLGPQDVTPASSFLASAAQPSIWQSLVVVRVADTTFERGGWDVGHDDKLVGVRRRPRPPITRKANSDPRMQQGRSVGLTAAALDRWELWTFDPAESRLQAFPLLALNQEPPRKRQYEVDTSSGSLRMTAPLPKMRGVVVPRLHFTRVSSFVCIPGCCLAGFGNTVGLFRFHPLSGRQGSSSGRSSGSSLKPPKEGRNANANAE